MQMDFLFKVIQYIERQVVLVDALEDAAYGKLNSLEGRGSLNEFMNRMERAGNLNELMNRLQAFSIRPVLTAHPTQFYPGRVLAIITDLTDAIQANDLSAIRMYLKQLGKTPFFQKTKPTPYDEAINLIWYLQNVFYQSAGEYGEDAPCPTELEWYVEFNQPGFLARWGPRWESVCQCGYHPPGSQSTSRCLVAMLLPRPTKIAPPHFILRRIRGPHGHPKRWS